MEPEKHVLILAGGDGKRVDGYVPKQFLLIGGIPLLFHTFNSFLFLNGVKFTLVINSSYVDYWNKLCSSTGFNIPHKIAEGGPTRFHSVKRGLRYIPDDSLVLIHDAARPFVSEETINRVIDVAVLKGNAVPAIKVVDSIREINAPHNKCINRNKLRAIQTPQGFKAKTIKKGYDQSYIETFTDDASVMESMGERINLVEGNSENIKISNPIDFVVGEGILNYLKQNNQFNR